MKSAVASAVDDSPGNPDALPCRAIREDFAGSAAEYPTVSAVSVDMLAVDRAGDDEDSAQSGIRIRRNLPDDVRPEMSSRSDVAMLVRAASQLADESRFRVRSVSRQSTAVVKLKLLNLATEHCEVVFDRLLSRGLCCCREFRREVDRAADQQRGNQRELDERDP